MKLPMQRIRAYCPYCEIEQWFTYEVFLKSIHGGDYEYGTSPGCTIVIEWTCEDGFIMDAEEIELTS